jgi:hypothetical protein
LPDVNETRYNCLDPSHHVKFSYWEEDADIYVYLHVTPFYSFWKKLKTAISYVFNGTLPFGMYKEIILQKEDAEKFRKIANMLDKQ